MTDQTRPFHLGDILSITTEVFVAPRGVEALYDLLGYMTGESLFTHQLTRAADECAPRLLEQHPDLADVRTPPEWEEQERPALEAVQGWLAEQVARFGETRDVAPLPAEDHASIDPLVELERVKPGGVIPVVLPDEPHGPQGAQK